MTESATSTASPASSPDAAALGFSVLSGNPTPAELAVVTAVLTAAIEDFRGLRITRYELRPMMDNVLGLRENFTVYDAAYIVLAQALDAPLVTADGKLTEARKLGIDIQVFRPPA